MLNAAPVLMVRNEERFIASVLHPILAAFGFAIVGDIGSTDQTREIVAAIPGAILIPYGPLSMKDVGQCRAWLALEAKKLGYKWAFLVDGDELYEVEALEHIAEQDMPEGARLGYTSLVSVDEDERGNFWTLDNMFGRMAVFPTDAEWRGEYPFESPVLYGDAIQNPKLNHYFTLPPGAPYHGYHLHRLRRSGHDANVHLRQQKQYQFSMQNVPGIKRVEKIVLPLVTNPVPVAVVEV